MNAQKSFLLIFLAIVCSCTQTSNLSSPQNSEPDEFRYELEAQNTGIQGTYLLKVWTYAPDPNDAVRQAPKNAVHGVLFKGFPGANRVTGQQALIRDTKTEKEFQDYFSSFFQNGGPYQRYVSLTNSGSILPGGRLKIGEGENAEYKVGVIVSVNVADLRRHLEGDGIIEPLNAGFD